MAPPNRTNPPESSEPKRLNWSLTYFLVAAAILAVLHSVYSPLHAGRVLPYSEFLQELEAGHVASVTLNDTTLVGELHQAAAGGDKLFSTVVFDDQGLVQKLRDHGVRFQREVQSPWLGAIVSWVMPLVLVFALWGFIARRIAGGMQGGVLSLSKSKARIFMEKSVKTTFADVAGVDEAKDELREVVSFLKEPDRYARLGGRIPKGVLLVGPPGTGKTLLARAVAGEANVTFFSINGSEFVEMFVGLGAARVRDLFAEARRAAPCILFIDEVDALGKSRALSGPSLGANDEKEQTLNQLLAEMDGFDAKEGVIILAATNRPETLDQALLRAGRFDRQVLVGLPDQAGRNAILRVHMQKIQVDPTADAAKIAGLTPGFSGADLANLVNEAALIATRRDAAAVSEGDFVQAIERIVAGLEQKRKVIRPEEKRKVAYHEMGHATVALTYGVGEKVQKVSIIPRGIGALGYTLRRPTEDRYLMDSDEMLGKIAVLLAGRAAEIEILGKASTGAADDLVKATELAREMVTRLGMSERLGLIAFEAPRTRFLAGGGGGESLGAFSDATAQAIDQEIKRLIDRGYGLALDAIRANRSFIDAGAARLLAVETLDDATIEELWHRLGGQTNAPKRRKSAPANTTPREVEQSRARPSQISPVFSRSASGTAVAGP